MSNGVYDTFRFKSTKLVKVYLLSSQQIYQATNLRNKKKKKNIKLFKKDELQVPFNLKKKENSWSKNSTNVNKINIKKYIIKGHLLQIMSR